MQRSEFITRVTRQFLLIFALVMIVLTLLRQLYIPELPFDLQSIYIIMGFSLVAAMLEFILYTADNVSENQMRLRRLLHFVTLEAVLIALASAVSIVTTLSESILLAIQIAVIYGMIRLLSWRRDKKLSNDINEKLQLLRKELDEERTD